VCGIAGLYARRGTVDPRMVRAMTAVQTHRGPVEEGYLLTPRVGLGMRRLSIIDVAGGRQPVYNEDGSIAVVFNGEIFNYRELRAELFERGHRLTTASDTEVIVHLYEERGVDCLHAFNGMFAFALWDGRRERLFLARDRLGVKPLYYWDGVQGLAFASELKALLLCDFVERRPDPHAVLDYLALMYIRAPRTPFQDVYKLLPGHYLVADRAGTRVDAYWRLADHCTPARISVPEAVERVRELLRDAVRLRLRSDVPVGAFLSGGIDSSAIVALAAQESATPLRTFTVDFGPDSFDEVRYARLVADRYATAHHEMRATVDDALQELPRLVWHMDEPHGDSAIVSTYLVSRFAASQLRVVLSGSGGDEVFGGYRRYFDGGVVDHLYRRLPWGLRAAGARWARRVSEELGARLAWNALPAEQRYLRTLSLFQAPERRRLLGGVVQDALDLREVFAAVPRADPVNRLMYVDAVTYLPDDILHVTDRMSMAVSLEARTPFLDYRLVEFAAGLPGRWKVDPWRRSWKILLKRAVAPWLPPAILARPKWGFGAPLRAWMRQGLLDVLPRVYRESAAVRAGLLQADGVAALLQAARTGPMPVHVGQQLWSLLVLELWSRLFLRGPAAQAPAFTLRDLAA